jgi:hypothetical protein
MEPDGSSPPLQMPATCLFLEPNKIVVKENVFERTEWFHLAYPKSCTRVFF